MAGGWGQDGVLSTVEVMNNKNLQWSAAADLPQPIYASSTTVCGDQFYMLGGADIDGIHTKTVNTWFTIYKYDLLWSCV